MMGMCLDSTPEMDDYSVEVRRESFYLRSFRNAIHVYPDTNCLGDVESTGDIECLIADIPKIRAALDLVENYRKTK